MRAGAPPTGAETLDFFDRIEGRARARDTLVCVGLDPHPESLSIPTAEAALAFCLRLALATAPFALAFKPNAAFFEAFGAPGVAALAALIRDIAPLDGGIPVILDAKRGDIASTGAAYARAAWDALGADAITLSPWLGADGITPFLAAPHKGVFVLCRTSNPGAAEIQEVRGITPEGPRPMYEIVTRRALSWGAAGRLGFVAGATHPEALGEIRAAASDRWILAPGVGAQGGDLAAALKAGLRADGLGLLVSASRGIANAPDPGEAARALRDAIRAAREAPSPQPVEGPAPLPRALRPLADGLFDAGCVRFGEFTLKSGLKSPVYIDLRRLVSSAGLLSRAASAYLPLVRGLTFDHLAPLPYAGLPIGTAVALLGGYSQVYPRKEVKAYGTKAVVEGVFEAGQTVVIIDDLATTGASSFEAIERLGQAGLKVTDAVVLIDRLSGAGAAMAARGVTLHAVFTLRALVDYGAAAGRIDPEAHRAVLDFLAGEGRP